MIDQRLHRYREYLEVKGYSDSSIRSLMAQAVSFQSAAEKGRDYLSRLKRRKELSEISPNTFNQYQYCLSTYFDYLSETGHRVPQARLLREKEIETRADILSVDQIRRLFKSADLKPELAARDRAVLGCLYHLGLRAGEATRLKPSDIDFREKLVFISRSKTGYQRRVPMSPGVEQIFLGYLQIRSKPSLGNCFLQGLKGNLSADGLLQIVKRMALQAGIKQRVYPHLLRHSIASHLLTEGMSLKQVSLFLGHRYLESTQRYTHLIEEGK